MTAHRRPTALDRDIANYIRALPDGSAEILIESAERVFLGAARLKPEGAMLLDVDGKRITIVPKVP